MKYDVAVVGDGPAGLSAAQSAAKAGCKRLCSLKEKTLSLNMFEQAESPGFLI